MPTIRTIKAMQGVPGMSQSEIDEFLGNSKTILRLGSVDRNGDPMIHPVWYHFAANRLYLMTGKNSRKVKNMNRKSRVYFSVDTDSQPIKGVKGKGTAIIVKDNRKMLEIAEKIVSKYLGGLDSPMAKGLMDMARSGADAVIEITPSHYSVWDYGKMTAKS